jgi:hypothetical protein
MTADMPKQRFSGKGPTGLGDVVEAVTKATGIKAATEAVAKATGKDCGCAKRRDKLNKIFPFRGGRDGVQSDQD